jgi:hypothetical protein
MLHLQSHPPLHSDRWCVRHWDFHHVHRAWQQHLAAPACRTCLPAATACLPATGNLDASTARPTANPPAHPLPLAHTTTTPASPLLQGWKGMGVVVASNYPNLLKLNTELQYGPDGYASSSIHTGIGFNRQAHPFPHCYLFPPSFLFFAPEGRLVEDPGGVVPPSTLINSNCCRMTDPRLPTSPLRCSCVMLNNLPPYGAVCPWMSMGGLVFTCACAPAIAGPGRRLPCLACLKQAGG